MHAAKAARDRQSQWSHDFEGLQGHPPRERVTLYVGGRIGLEHERGAQPGDPDLGMRRLELVEHALLGRLVDAVLRRLEFGRGPGLVTLLLLVIVDARRSPKMVVLSVRS